MKYLHFATEHFFLRMYLQQETGATPLAQGWLARELELPAWGR